jgi:hypothetical protein
MGTICKTDILTLILTDCQDQVAGVRREIHNDHRMKI